MLPLRAYVSLYTVSHKSSPQENCYLEKYGNNVKQVKLLQIMCFQSCVRILSPRTSRYSAVNTIKLRQCCQVDMTAKGDGFWSSRKR